MRKGILKLGWNLQYIGEVTQLIRIADAISKLQPVEFHYLDEVGGVYVDREDCSEPELDFLNDRKHLAIHAFKSIKQKQDEDAA